MNKKIKILILTLLFAVPGIFAQTVEIEKLYSQEPGSKTVGFFMNDFTGLSNKVAAATFVIKINGDLLEFTGLSNQVLPGLTANFNQSNNLLTIVYTNPAGANPTGKVFDMNFNYQGGAVAHLIFEVLQCELKNVNNQSITATFENGYINPVATSQMIVLDQEFAQIPGPVTLSLNMIDFEGPNGNVGAITLWIKFNKNLLTFNGFSNAHVTPINVNYHNADNTLKINYTAGSQGFDINGKLMDLHFTYLGGGPVNLIFSTGDCEIAKFGDLGVIPASYTNGLVSDSNTGIVGELSIPSSEGALIGNTVSLPIEIEAFNTNSLTNVNSISLRIGYDPSKLQYVGTSNNVLFVENSFVPGIISLGWSSTAPQNFSGPGPVTLLNLDFRVIAPGESDVVFLSGTEVTSNTVPEYLARKGGSVIGGNARVRVFLEGFYIPAQGQMRKAQGLEGIVLTDQFAGNIADLITIELHNENDAYGTDPLVFPDLKLNQDGYAYFTATGLTPNVKYYITVKHRNHLETVSRLAASFDKLPLTWDFTEANVNPNDYKGAFGNNQKTMSDGKFAIFAGDITGQFGVQDGEIDIIDRGNLINAIGNEGYLLQDLDGSGEVDILDRGIVINNIGKQAITP